MNPQAKYFGILHTSKKTSYTEGNTLIFSDLKTSFEADSFKALENNIDQLSRNYLLGYLGYDLKNSIEKLPEDEDFFINTPKAWFGSFDKVEKKSSYQLPTTNYQLPKVSYIKSNMTKAEYLQKVEKVREYISAGDIYQANITRKFYGEFAQPVDAFSLYCKLNEISPAPYSAYLKIDDLHIISSSPELFIRVDAEGNAITCPIKGSAGKGEGAELAGSDKDRSENLMITDLMRSDFSHSCVPGSVKVDGLFEVDEFKTISHMHSTITGKLKQGETPLSLIKNCFPPGSMTGAPKIRSMEIISELEKHKRGIYSGVLGYFGSGQAEFSVVIRTIIIRGNKFEFQVGGGIIYESEPEKEWAETMLKARAIAEVLGVGEEIKKL